MEKKVSLGVSCIIIKLVRKKICTNPLFYSMAQATYSIGSLGISRNRLSAHKKKKDPTLDLFLNLFFSSKLTKVTNLNDFI